MFIKRLQPTQVWDTYWYFAYKRLEIWWDRHTGGQAPWTDDPTLAEHRFTNTYRILDRVTQYLVREIQYNPQRSQHPDELFFRTLLFKFFNKIETWQLLEDRLGPMSWQSFDPNAIIEILGKTIGARQPIYSAAYIIPAPAFGHGYKHANHIELLFKMMRDGLPGKIHRAGSLEEVYELILAYPGMGPFLAFHYAIDLNYSTLCDHDESTFVVAGPGAIDGLQKCFSSLEGLNFGEAIMETYYRQKEEFNRLDLDFPGLFGRPLMPIDIQNCYCETSKYTRVSHPLALGSAGRVKIKQKYKLHPSPIPIPFFPPKWNIVIPPDILCEMQKALAI